MPRRHAVGPIRPVDRQSPVFERGLVRMRDADAEDVVRRGLFASGAG